MMRSFVYGVLNTNSYLVWQGKDAVLVDLADPLLIDLHQVYLVLPRQIPAEEHSHGACAQYGYSHSLHPPEWNSVGHVRGDVFAIDNIIIIY